MLQSKMGWFNKNKKFSLDKLPRIILTQVNNFYQNKIDDNQLESILINFEKVELQEILNEHHLNIKSLISLIKDEKTKINSRRGFLSFLGKGAIVATGTVAGVSLNSNIANAPNINNKLNIKSLFLALKKIPELESFREFIYLNEKVKTIILVSDIHGNDEIFTDERFKFLSDLYLKTQKYKLDKDETWEKEFIQLERLRNNFGLNFVGVEGWAGNEVDEKRKRVIINGEEILVKKLIKDFNYFIVGLEDYKLQHDMLELELLEIWNTEKAISLINKEEVFDMFIENFYFYSKLNEKALVQFSNNIFNLTKIRYNNFESKVIINSWVQVFFQIKRLYPNKNGAEVEIYYENIKIVYDYLQKKYASILGENFSKEKEKILMFERNQFAIKKMLEEMNKQKQNIGVIVFGVNHIDGLIEELNKQTNNQINIYIAK